MRSAARHSGDEVLVQVKSRRSGGKADIVSEDIALTGNKFIYLPTGTSIALSRRLDGARGRALRGALENAGVKSGIVRSAAVHADLAEVLHEAKALQAEWQRISASKASSGTMLAPGPDAATRLETDYSGQTIATRQATLEDRDLGTSIAALQAAKVDLPGGSSLMIEPTAALTAIDVNAGTMPAAAANREALAIIASQLRLRNLSGLILIDFAGGQAQPLLKPLEKMLGSDPAGCRIGGLTPAGLVEITRPRRDLPLAEKLNGAR